MNDERHYGSGSGNGPSIGEGSGHFGGLGVTTSLSPSSASSSSASSSSLVSTVPLELGTKEWMRLIVAFRSSPDEREKLMQTFRLTEDSLLEQLLTIVRAPIGSHFVGDRGDRIQRDGRGGIGGGGGGGGADRKEDVLFRITLLVFLQENVAYLLEDGKRMEVVCTVLNTILNSNNSELSGPFCQLKTQVLTTLTTILIELSVLQTQRRVFESFIEVLLDIISKVNNSSDRSVRAMACECLREFELIYPGLLSQTLGHLLSFCQTENTHAFQSYLSLFSTVLNHVVELLFSELPALIMQHGVTSPSSTPSSSLSAILNTLSSTHLQSLLPFLHVASDSKHFTILSLTQTELSSFTLPTLKFSLLLDGFSFSSAPTLPSFQLPDSLNKEILRCISLMVDNGPLFLNHWGLSPILLKLISMVHFLNLPVDLFKHNFSKLIFSTSPIYIHSIVFLKKLFFDLFDQKQILGQLFMIIQDEGLSVESRILALKWLQHFPVDVDLLSGPSSHSGVLDESSYDQAQLSLLNRHFFRILPSVFDPIIIKEAKLKTLVHCFASSSSSSSSSPLSPPKNILDVLICFQEFRFLPSNSPITHMVFKTLHLFLFKFRELFNDVYKFLLDTILQDPRYLGNVIQFVDRLDNNPGTSELAVKLVELFNNVLISSVRKDSLPNYLDLIERIAAEPSIDPNNIIRVLLTLLEQTNYCDVGDWQLGNSILSICRRLMVHHPTPLIFKSLTDLLLFCARFFNDVDVRDRSFFYYQLLTHALGDKIKVILAKPILPDDEETAGLVSLSISRPATCLKTVPSFLSLTRLYNCEIPENLLEAVWKIEDEYKFVVVANEGTSAGYPLPPSPSSSFSSSTSPLENGNFGSPSGELPLLHSTLLRKHLAAITHPRFKPLIQIPFLVSYRSDWVKSGGGTGGVEGFNSKVYSVVFQFSKSPIYSPIPPLRVPYLVQQPDKTSTSYEEGQDLERFPFRYQTLISFHPLAPLPTSLKVTVTFNDPTGKTCQSFLEPVNLQFQDLFVPMPRPKQDPVFGTRLFAEMWKQITLPNYGLQEGVSILQGQSGAKSVKYLELSQARMKALLRTVLSPFVVEEIVSPTTGIETVKLLIFLPPRYHLLIKFVVTNSTVAKIRTDYWKVLAFLDVFFDTLQQFSASSALVTPSVLPPVMLTTSPTPPPATTSFAPASSSSSPGTSPVPALSPIVNEFRRKKGGVGGLSFEASTS